MKRLIECVPNFSEGRDPAKVDAIVSAMSTVPGVYVLDREMDADHNRCVITLAGEPDAVAEAALRGVGKAMELIDLTKHTGAHPRVGATDVVPFIPIEGVTIEDCVALARRIGHEIWARYRIPVFFYEAAATRPDRVNLENVRRGQFEGLREEMKRNHDRQPDVGEPKVHPTAGVTVVGARKFLIAYNVNLNTSDVGIANKIAKAIRFSSGGLRYVKSMGVELKARNLAQVSINLTDFEQTPMHRVYEMVKREAERYGAMPVGSEIVGLIPKKAIEMAADFFLQLENFSPAQVFENKLAAALSGAPLRSGQGRQTRRVGAPFPGCGGDADGHPRWRQCIRSCRRFGGFTWPDGCRTLSQKEISGCLCRQAVSGTGLHAAGLRRTDGGHRPRRYFVRSSHGRVQVAKGQSRRNTATGSDHSSRHQDSRGGPASGGGAQRCTFRTSGTTGCYRRGIHEVRLGSSTVDGHGGCARGLGQRRDQPRWN